MVMKTQILLLFFALLCSLPTTNGWCFNAACNMKCSFLYSNSRQQFRGECVRGKCQCIAVTGPPPEEQETTV
ncbi:unnamed protein product [Bursaphelenchus xylophilus]|uniref:(pine wood nematode) hypothetical protein n=1 Tax=Bursaphelenchus xylophilus TaxID=6326 RepID=A0A1I7RUG6_BURXY|nr:unnamed protein product [Bursaphelenchus xylophilus]CAG9114112.1 unnamed protein product [Bursaphelenchus xylophilus]